ncbi:MAG: bacterial transcriptional activator domain-containing protein, partial [Betaproteobacteria bacterium]
ATSRASGNRLGDTERAVDYLHRVLDMDDLAESLYRQLMQCYVDLGRFAEAVEGYARCRAVLAARLGVEPSLETRGIYEKLVSLQ